MTRRESIAALAAGLASAASRLPANRNVKWGLGSNLWNYFPRVPFTEILDVMRDTGFIGLRLTQFPQILKTYGITAAQMEKEASKRDCRIVTISFNGPAHDASKRSEVVASARTAMNFLKDFGASHLVVFPPNRTNLTGEASFKSMCEGFNAIGEAAREGGHDVRGFRRAVSRAGRARMPLHAARRPLSRSIQPFPEFEHETPRSRPRPASSGRKNALSGRFAILFAPVTAGNRRSGAH